MQRAAPGTGGSLQRGCAESETNEGTLHHEVAVGGGMLPLLLLLLTACGHAAANASDGCVPSAVKTVYVVCTSHIDTGFDHPIDEMERCSCRTADRAP